MEHEIKIILLDIDGVLTTGKVLVNSAGDEIKQLDFKDIDGAFEIKRMGLKLGFLTKEQTAITEFLKKRFEPDYFYSGISNKLCAIDEICRDLELERRNVCYMGDGKYDVAGVEAVGLGVCPRNAISEVKQVAKLILSNDGGAGCVWELVTHLKAQQRENELTKSLTQHIDAVNRIKLDFELQQRILDAADVISACYRKHGKVLIAGNGGSASDAQHIATELISRFYFNRPPLDAESLTANTSAITALANDYGYDIIFARQVEAKARAGDVFIGLTTSGKSENVVLALKTAREKGATTIALVGESVNRDIRDYTDVIISIPSGITPRIQECHILVGHMICEIVERKLFQAF